MTDPLEVLWSLVDAPDTLAAAHVVARWPAGVHQRLVKLGFLHPAAEASHVLCPECGEHFEEVLALEGPGGQVRFAVPCPVVLRADVPPAARRRWAVDHARFAGALATGLALTGKCTELVPGRLWRLGRTMWQGKPRDVLLARGLHWNDGQTIRAKLVRGHKPIVFVPMRRPPDDFWRTVPPVVVLSHVAILAGDGIEIDPMEVAAAIYDADAAANSKLAPGLSKEDLKRMIRQQVKAENGTQLTDDIYHAAYRQCGTVRDAASFLKQETGREVSKDQVQRALTRMGGAAAVLNSDDSNSIVRGVLSRRRDKHGKPIIQSQPPEES